MNYVELLIRIMRLWAAAFSRAFIALMCAAFAGIFIACASSSDDDVGEYVPRKPEQERAKLQQKREAANAQALKQAIAALPLVQYYRVALDSRERLDSVRKHFGKKPSTMLAYRVFTTINRKDIHFFRLGDTALFPSVFHEDLRVYSVFPPLYPGADTLKKLIVISNAYQAYACYEYGKLTRFAACNTGREGKPTFPGRYALNWRDKIRRSSLDSSWVLPFTWNFHLYAGNAFHQFDMPGRPESHSCVRQFIEDAEWLFKWGEGGAIDTARRKYIPMTGTPVLIIDVFDYTRKKGGPWLELVNNKDFYISLPPDPLAVEEAYIPISQIPHEVRWDLPNKERYLVAEDTLRARGLIRSEAVLEESINYNKLRRERERAKEILQRKLEAQKEKQKEAMRARDDSPSSQ
jgi:hypothetical protein